MPLPGQRLYANSIWIGPAAADNFLVGRGGNRIQGIVVHHSASTLSGLIARFTNPPATSGGGASAHFAVDREEETRDGLLGFGQYAIGYQLVDTSDTAFHAANFQINETTVGVEHVRLWGSGPGTAGYEPITNAQYRFSHELALIISRDNGFGLDSGTVTPHNLYTQTTCPGDLDLTQIIAGPTGGGGFLMALSDAQQQELYDRLVGRPNDGADNLIKKVEGNYAAIKALPVANNAAVFAELKNIELAIADLKAHPASSDPRLLASITNIEKAAAAAGTALAQA